MDSIKLGKIYLERMLKNKKSIYTKIKRHPYYISLLKFNKWKYKKYVHLSNYQSSKPSAKWKNIMQIYNEISSKGFDFSNNDKIKISKNKKNEKNICIHGRHRICMLYLIYGSDSTLELLNDSVVGISNNSPIQNDCQINLTEDEYEDEYEDANIDEDTDEETDEENNDIYTTRIS
uniref:Uncharacterized protein n=1 Tax=viral metagenome TaxID=1070528 RepID=A0A6C0F351_9ZZZZ